MYTGVWEGEGIGISVCGNGRVFVNCCMHGKGRV